MRVRISSRISVTWVTMEAEPIICEEFFIFNFSLFFAAKNFFSCCYSWHRKTASINIELYFRHCYLWETNARRFPILDQNSRMKGKISVIKEDRINFCSTKTDSISLWSDKSQGRRVENDGTNSTFSLLFAKAGKVVCEG